MNKIIMLLENIKDSNYIIEENIIFDKDLRIMDSKGKTLYVIEFNTEVNHNFVWDYNNSLNCGEYVGALEINDIENLIREFYQV